MQSRFGSCVRVCREYSYHITGAAMQPSGVKQKLPTPKGRYSLAGVSATRFDEMLKDITIHPYTHENWYLVKFDEGDHAWMKESEMEHDKGGK